MKEDNYLNHYVQFDQLPNHLLAEQINSMKWCLEYVQYL